MLTHRDLRDAAAYVVGAAGIPYGYTLTVWGAGALCTARFGLPSAAEAFGFVGGASVAYFGLALGLRRANAPAPRHGAAAPLMLWENFASLPALAASYGVSRLVPGPGASFFLVPLVATFLYLVAVSLLAFCFHFRPEASRWEHRDGEHEDVANRQAMPARCATPRREAGGRGPSGREGEG